MDTGERTYRGIQGPSDPPGVSAGQVPSSGLRAGGRPPISKELIKGLVIAAAWTAASQVSLKGCGQSVLVDGKGSFDLWYYIDQQLPGFRFKVVLCEGKKDRAPLIPEGSIIGRGSDD